jgi:hypothetical protein
VAAIAFSGCGKDDDNPGETPVTPPVLSVAPASIPATAATGTYTIAVTANVAWTATVSSGATWCTLANASATGNGTVTVNVVENPTAASRAATVTVTAGTLTQQVAVTQAGAAPTLTTAPTAIPATSTADSYTIAVTSNTAWTATVNTAATWCTLANANATGNGTVTVNIVENPIAASRAATVTVAAGTLTQQVAVTQAGVTPSYAASTQTWTFGAQTWSDAIRIPECDKESFTSDYNNPQCRSYTEGANTWYYYNWPYVNANKGTLCPSPWRVPSREDFDALVSNTTYSALSSAWGYGGYTISSLNNVSVTAYHWSSTESSSNITYAHFLRYGSDNLYVTTLYKDAGMQVRCVR